MPYRWSQQQSREFYLSAYDADEASRYDAWIKTLTDQDHDACLEDIQEVAPIDEWDSVLDAGSGTGGLCLALVRIPGIQITALEPCDSMSELLQAKPELASVSIRHGFCDSEEDRSHFSAATFQAVVSRQLVNCLYDPMTAFRNWHYWLKPGGFVVVMDGLFDRDGWSGRWQQSVDHLPLSACRTRATVPYLLEAVGFEVQSCGPMSRTNRLPSTRTERYMVVAKKGTANAHDAVTAG